MTPDAETDSPLEPRDAEAIDALVEAGFDLDRVAPDLREAAAAALAMLGPLDQAGGIAGAESDRAARREATLATIAQRAAYVSADAHRLSPDSEDAVDVFVMAEGASRRVPSAYRDRTDVIDRAANAMTTLDADGEAWIAESRGDRIERAMAAIDASSAHDAIPLAPDRSRFRLADLVSVAALLLIGSAVVMPVIGMVNQQARTTNCFAHLGATAEAFGAYAIAHRDELPVAHAGFGSAALGRSWMRVGEDPSQSNSANLFTLARSGFTTLETLSCPGNERAPRTIADPDMQDWATIEQISYSYQILPGAARPRTMFPSGAVVLTDRSPVILRVARGEPINPDANSPNHRGEGQHVLRLDGSVIWAPTPVLKGGDNLWLPRSIELVIHEVRSKVGIVEGHELPESPDDAFVGP